MSNTVIDPVTRVGGHLRIEVAIENGVVTDAWSSGTMFRGLEHILRGRDPRDAWLLAQRTCGVCVGAHALASVRAVENALGVTIPPNARLVRNLLAGTSFVVGHVTGFYHRALIDWIDLDAALSTDMGDVAALVQQNGAGGPNTSIQYFTSIRDRLQAALAAGRTGPFAGAAVRHPANAALPAEHAFLMLAHYVQSLDWARRAGMLETMLGGKSPHPQTFAVGGMLLVPPWSGATGAAGGHPDQVDKNMPSALGPDGMAQLQVLVNEVRAFVDTSYLPDTIRLARSYPEWSTIGAGVGTYLSYGEFPQADVADPTLLLPGGWVTAEAPGTGRDVEADAITESVAHSWYEPDATSRRPSEWVTAPKFGDVTLPIASVQSADRYSWLKAPRYQGTPMEVGPLARVLVAYAQGGREVRAVLDGLLAVLGAQRDTFAGTLGRTLARAVEAEVVSTALPAWLSELHDSMAAGDLAFADVTSWSPDSWPPSATGVSFGESSRGALAHWVGIRDRRVSDYAIVDASTWNASPRDERGTRGPLEQALIGTHVADPSVPIEVLRTVHSFDPCTACAVHAWDPLEGSSSIRVVTRRRPGRKGR